MAILWPAHMIDSDRKYWPDKEMFYTLHKFRLLVYFSQFAVFAQYLSALPGLDGTKVRMICKISCMVWLCKYETVRLFWLDSSNAVVFWDMMLAARAADSVLHSAGWCSRSIQKKLVPSYENTMCYCNTLKIFYMAVLHWKTQS